jgi:hypothetical protein
MHPQVEGIRDQLFDIALVIKFRVPIGVSRSDCGLPGIEDAFVPGRCAA